MVGTSRIGPQEGRGRLETRTLTGTPAFATAFANSTTLGELFFTNITYSGAATGTRYAVAASALINTNGGGANYFPGNAAGGGAGTYL